ncbi:hypothetical protein PG994_007044 [Apiospora phragmitis]|uniref:Uncharacterized protein n=1 Tax=Apiospora phragmitis TaxID=2905665 RepID=A0ABR1UZR3_9PEZI
MKDPQHHQCGSSSATAHVEHCIVPCRRSFAEAKAALEAAVPLLDRTYQRHLDAGDLAAAGEALRMLPTLSRFGARPRDFGPILRAEAAAAAIITAPPLLRGGGDGSSNSNSKVTTTTVKEAVQYEIGEPAQGGADGAALRKDGAVRPDTRSIAASGRGGCLISAEAGEKGRRASSKGENCWCQPGLVRVRQTEQHDGQTGIREVDEISRGLDEALHDILAKAAGLGSGVERSEPKI